MRESLASAAVEGIRAGKIHPHTGEPLLPVGFRRNGDPIWPIMGASEDDGDDGNDDGSDDGGGAGGNDDGDDGNDAGDDGDDDGGDSEHVRALKAEAARRRHREKELKQQLSDVSARLKEFEDRDKGEGEKLSTQVSELTKQNQELASAFHDLAIQNAFLSDTTHQWKNPKTALKLVDLAEVEIEDDGTVTGLSEALKKLAKSDPYLLKSADEDDEDDEQPPAGQPPRKRRNSSTSTREALEKKYPALRR